MASSPPPDERRHRALRREVRRALFIVKQALERWGDDEPDLVRATVAHGIGEMLLAVTRILGALNEDGQIQPGDARMLHQDRRNP